MTDPLQAASEWYVRLNDPDLSEQDRQAFAHWQAASPGNREAWARIERISAPFAGLSPALGRAVLQQHAPGRREAFKKLGLLLAIGGGATLAWQQAPWQPLLADQSAGRGQRRTVTLPDGTVLVLNSNTAIDIRYSDSERTVALLEGEVMVETGHGGNAAVPFRVQTRRGSLTALGTRFAVRDHDDHVSLDVFEHAVRIQPAAEDAPARVISAGETARFDRHAVLDVRPLQPGADLWVHGVLSVNDMPMKDFLSELARHHRPLLRCDASLERLPVSGAFPVDDLDAILASLRDTHGLRIQYFTRYWITLLPA